MAPPNQVSNTAKLPDLSAQPPNGNSEGEYGSVCLLPKFFAALKQIRKNPQLNERGWAQLDKDLANQLVMRATSMIARDPKSDPHGASSFGTNFHQYKLNNGGGWGKHRRY